MNKKLVLFLIITILSFILIACSNQEETERQQDSSKSNEEKSTMDQRIKEVNKLKDVPEPSNSLNEVLTYPVGRFAGLDFRASDEDKKRVLKTFNGFPKLTDNTSEEVLGKHGCSIS